MEYIILTLIPFALLIIDRSRRNNLFLKNIEGKNLLELINLSPKAANRSKRVQIEFYLYFKKRLFQFLITSRQKPEKNALTKLSQDLSFYFDAFKNDFLFKSNLDFKQMCYDEFFEPEQTEAIVDQVKIIFDLNQGDIMNQEGLVQLIQFVRKTNAHAKHNRLSLLLQMLEKFKKETQKITKKESMVLA